MNPLRKIVEAWLDNARGKFDRGTLEKSDLDQLGKTVQSVTQDTRQRLLYVHTREPSVHSEIIGMAEHEPVVGQRDRLRTRKDWPFGTVQEAMADGWHVIHFPNLMAPFDDREVDFIGFEFILQKMEIFNG